MGNAMNAECGLNHHVLRSITLILMALLVAMILLTVLCSALLAISKRQEAMLDEFLKRSGNMQDTLELYNPKTHSQAGSIRYGREK
jgi:multidrug efflux pump subunit AcrB